MTGEQAYDQVERVANNAYMMLVARVAMIVCSLGGPPLAVWMVHTINDTAKTLALVQQDIVHSNGLRASGDMQNKMDIESLRSEMRDRTQDRYRTEDAVKDFRLRDLRLDQHDRRIDTLERQPRP